jgi:hypothetical protein
VPHIPLGRSRLSANHHTQTRIYNFMKKYIITIDCALVAPVINTTANDAVWWDVEHEQHIRDRNHEIEHRLQGYPTYQKR